MHCSDARGCEGEKRADGISDVHTDVQTRVLENTQKLSLSCQFPHPFFLMFLIDGFKNQTETEGYFLLSLHFN